MVAMQVQCSSAHELLHTHRSDNADNDDVRNRKGLATRIINERKELTSYPGLMAGMEGTWMGHRVQARPAFLDFSRQANAVIQCREPCLGVKNAAVEKSGQAKWRLLNDLKPLW